MFTSGQWVVAIVFIFFFILLMIYSYSKDKSLHKKNYKGVVWILAGFLLFIVFLFLIKFILKG